jgi:hypothetical protein
MATKEDIKQTLYDELASLIDDVTDVQRPYDHVRVADRDEDERQPSYAFRETVIPYKLGLDGNVHVDDVTYDSEGYAQEVIYRRDQTISFEILATDDNDDVASKDALYVALQDFFTQFNTPAYSPSDFHADVQHIEVFGTTDVSRPDEAIRGDSFRVDIRYGRYTIFDDFQPMREIRQSFDDDSDTVYITD